MNETDLLWMLMAEVPKRLPDVRIFRRNIINTLSTQGFRAVNGIKGQGDAYALVRGGKHVEIETKAARGQLRDAQEAWRKYCQNFSIPYVVLRALSTETPEQVIARWVDELSLVC